MKKILLCGMAALMAASASAEISVVFLSEETPSQLSIGSTPITANIDTKDMNSTVIDVTDGTATIPNAPQNSLYVMDINGGSVEFFAAPEDNILVTVNSIAPLDASVTGTELAQSVDEFEDQILPVSMKLRAIMRGEEQGNPEEVYNQLMEIVNTAALATPPTQKSAYALMYAVDEPFITGYDNLKASGLQTIIMPLIETKKQEVDKQMAAARAQEALESGNVMAPNFTLNNMEGKPVSLSDFRGKWVIIDFWGSWCGWCIKGFPALKEAYAKYAPKLEVIGVDCGDSVDAWKVAVEKHQLPWVHVYNPKDSNLTSEYAVQGFPTKVIVNPEGKIAKIVVGEEPSFYDTLANLLGEK